MDVALIAPLELLDMQDRGEMQLMLPHILHPEYVKHYRDRKQGGLFTILDNGAAEAVKPTGQELLRAAELYKVNELCIFDVLGRGWETVQEANYFFQYFRNRAIDLHAAGVAFGFVAQGSDLHIAQLAVDTVMLAPYAHMIKTVYLPRLLLDHGDLYARVKLATVIHKAYPHLNIHLFGTNRKWIREVYAASQECPFIRSVDTSLPFVAAQANVQLHTRLPLVGNRQLDFFEHAVSREERLLATYNVDVFLKWARGESCD